MSHKVFGKTGITQTERAIRQEAINYGRGSVRLEGFILDDATEALYQQYIEGDLSREELTRKILKFSDPLEGCKPGRSGLRACQVNAE